MREDGGEAFADDGGGSSNTQTAQKIPSVEIEIFRSNVAVGKVKLVLDEHVSCLEPLAAAAGCLPLIEYGPPAALDAEKAARFPGKTAFLRYEQAGRESGRKAMPQYVSC
jgi:hypothetical protein